VLPVVIILFAGELFLNIFVLLTTGLSTIKYLYIYEQSSESTSSQHHFFLSRAFCSHGEEDEIIPISLITSNAYKVERKRC